MIDVPVEVKETLQDGRRKKNYRFNVLNDDGTVEFTIDNNTLVSESVNIDERMCSGDKLKFGLCEGSSLEFQYFDHPNIKGRQIQVFIDVDYTETVIEKEYDTIKNLQKYELYQFTESGRYRVYSETEENFDYVWIWKGSSHSIVKVVPTNSDGICSCEFDAEEGDQIEVEFPGWGYAPAYLQSVQVTKYTRESVYTIPMGYFTAEKCSRQASTGIIKVTAYNKLQSLYLDQKANQLVLDSFDDIPSSLPIFSIKDTLLKDFEITPYTYGEQQPSIVASSRVSTLARNIHLADLTSDAGPINYYDLWYTALVQGITLDTHTNLTFWLESRAVVWDIYQEDPDNRQYYQLIENAYNLGILSETFAQYMIDFFEASPLDISGQDLVDGIKYIRDLQTGDYGWRDILGVLDVSDEARAYNDYAYKYQNTGLIIPIDGTTNDYVKKLLDDSSWRQITVYCPYSIRVEVPISQTTFAEIGEYKLIGDDPISYEGDGVTKIYPQFKYPDGAIIPDTDAPFGDWVKLYKIGNIAPADLVNIDPSSAPDYSLRDIITADYETKCQFGQLDRTTDMFWGAELNHSRLFPAEDLYPNNTLYPGGAALSSHRSMYSKLWGDEGDVKKWRYLIITYKGLDSQQNEKEFTLQKTVNADGNVDYNMSDNWLFKNLTWTDVQVDAYAEAMVAKMQDVTWFPFEMWCPGLPYLETGDEIEVSIGQSTYSTYILQRQLKGIQNLQDTYINGTLDIF